MLTYLEKVSGKASLRLWISCIEQHVSIFFTHVWCVRKAMLFRYIGRLVTNVYQKSELCVQTTNE